MELDIDELKEGIGLLIALYPLFQVWHFIGGGSWLTSL